MSAALTLLRRRPQFRALWLALALSYTGSGAATTALVLYVQQTRGTGGAVAALLIAETAPRLLGPLTGSVADRVDLRRLMIGADAAHAVVFALLALLPSFPLILALAAMSGALQTVYSPARTVALPALVEDSELLTANSLVGLASNLYVALGPLVGGLLFAAGDASAVMLVNAATFLASAQLTRSIRKLPTEERDEGREHESLLASARTGLRYAFANSLTRTVTLTIFFIFTFIAIDNVALVFLVRDTLGAGAAAYGIVSATFGVGMLLASLVVMRGTPLAPPALYLLALLFSGAGAILTGAAPAIAVVALTLLISGAGNGIEIVAGDTIFQQNVPRHLLGRVFGLTSTAVGVGTGISMALGGLLVDTTSPRVAFFVAGAGGLLAAAWAAPVLLRARPG